MGKKSVSIDFELFNRIKTTAYLNGFTVNKFIDKFLREHVKKMNTKK
jgi:predicted HicB family RNase H-like nuclease